MRTRTSTPGEADDSSAGRSAGWATRGSIMSIRSVASRKRTAARRLQARAIVLLNDAAALDSQAERLLSEDERS